MTRREFEICRICEIHLNNLAVLRIQQLNQRIRVNDENIEFQIEPWRFSVAADYALISASRGLHPRPLHAAENVLSHQRRVFADAAAKDHRFGPPFQHRQIPFYK